MKTAAPFTIQQVRRGNRLLTLNPPRIFYPKFRDGWEVEDKELDLLAYGHHLDWARSQLITEVEDYLFFLWDAYVKEDPSKLDQKAQHLRNYLLSIATVNKI
jgi:hypothetical protein